VKRVEKISEEGRSTKKVNSIEKNTTKSMKNNDMFRFYIIDYNSAEIMCG